MTDNQTPMDDDIVLIALAGAGYVKGGSMDTGQVTSMIAKADASGQFTVMFKWNMEKPKIAKVLVGKRAKHDD